MQSIDLWHRAFAVVGLVSITGSGPRIVGFLLFVRPDAGTFLAYQLVTGFIYLIAGVFVARHLMEFGGLLARNFFLYALLFLAILSLFWSPDTDLTFRRVTAATGVMFFATYMAMQFDLSGSLETILWALGIIAVLSFLAVFLAPATGIHQGGHHEGLWRGLYKHKNGFGREMALAAILFSLFTPPNWDRKLGLGLAALCLVLVFKSGSAQGVVLAIAVISIGIALRRMFELNTFLLLGSMIVLLASCAILVPISVSLASVALEALGRDATLTGRTILWEIAIEHTLETYPLLGYGFTGDFHVGDDVDMSLPDHAHNGFVQLFTELGLVGLLLFCLASLVHIRNLLISAVLQRTTGTLFLIVFSIYFYALSLVASPILATNSIIWALFVLVAIKASSLNVGILRLVRQTQNFNGVSGQIAPLGSSASTRAVSPNEIKN